MFLSILFGLSVEVWTILAYIILFVVLFIILFAVLFVVLFVFVLLLLEFTGNSGIETLLGLLVVLTIESTVMFLAISVLAVLLVVDMIYWLYLF